MPDMFHGRDDLISILLRRLIKQPQQGAVSIGNAVVDVGGGQGTLFRMNGLIMNGIHPAHLPPGETGKYHQHHKDEGKSDHDLAGDLYVL
ncbi:MAG: hypothetical protein FJX25_17710 [Alphaproteobacteria bacterium]|nr:hypothetical protein [Alphaproteobacteria bacterium]